MEIVTDRQVSGNTYITKETEYVQNIQNIFIVCESFKRLRNLADIFYQSMMNSAQRLRFKSSVLICCLKILFVSSS